MTRPVSFLAGVLAILVGGLVLLGWALDITAIKSITPGFASMKVNTAICFVLSGVALCLLAGARTGGVGRSLARLCAFLVAGVGALTLAEDLSGINFGIDQWLFPETLPSVNTGMSGRMAPATAFNFIITGAALLLISTANNRCRAWAQHAALVIGIIGMLAVLGYAYGVEDLYKFNPFSSMALHTAVLFMALAAGILALQPDQGLMSVLTGKHPGSVMARLLLPFAIVLPFVAGWLSMKGEQAGLYGDVLEMAFFAMITIIFFVTVVWISAWRLKRMEMSIMRQETMFQSLDESSLDAHVFVNERGRIVSVNPRSVALFGYARQELVDLPLDTLMPERFRARHAQHFAAYCANPHTRPMGIGMEFPARRKDGSEFPVEIALNPVQTNKEMLVYCVIRDITERKRAQEQVQRLANMLEESLNEIYVFDAETLKFQMVNRGARENIGYSMEELSTLTPLELKTEYTPESFATLIRPLRTGEQRMIMFTSHHRRKDGSVYPVEVHLQLFSDTSPAMFIAIILDITERKQQEMSLQQRTGELGRFNRMAVGREKRIIELKRQVNELSQELGKPKPYDLSFVEEHTAQKTGDS